MSSSEAGYAWRIARFYGPLRVQMSRQERIEFVRLHIARLESQAHEERVAHRAICPECQKGDPFCLHQLTLTPAEHERGNKLRFMRGLIHSEEQDEAYAQRARIHPV